MEIRNHLCACFPTLSHTEEDGSISSLYKAFRVAAATLSIHVEQSHGDACSESRILFVL